MDLLTNAYADLIAWIADRALLPFLYATGLMAWEEDATGWLDFAVLGVVQIILIWLVCRPLEAWKPVERWDDRREVVTDILYTILTRLGLLPLIVFVLFRPVQSWLQGSFADAGLTPPTLEGWFPILRDHSFIAFAAYVVILDFGDYWRHRLQHALPWWYALHAVHHAQTKMTFWTDDRNHLLDDLLAGLWFGVLALLIGVPPAQFPLIILLLRFVEALSHANVRLSFGAVGERLVVSPRFHRVHHGPLSAGEDGRNYAVLLPIWDLMFRTADFRRDVFPVTGDPGAPKAMATGSWWQQQVEGAKGLWRSLRGQPLSEAPQRAPAE
ncbi:sterol desaturase family protein [Roseomonas sp. CCTCC AB2023176]|uniref:sterol desaturase family protein n=1 Tax=Roseomonas sp. CCTCC AB2023176 TaxID=3342640 RepID=UPI0035DA2F9F